MRLLVFSLVFQIGYTVAGDAQEIQAEPVDSLVVEAEHQAATQQKKEPKEITIYIRGAHKAVASALLEAVEEETLVTGIADFDSLSSTYGLMGIHRKGRISPFYFGNRFRLTFPPDADVAAIAGAYWNLSYIQSIEPEPSSEVRTRKLTVKEIHPPFIKNKGLRLLTKVAVGGVVGGGSGFVGASIALGVGVQSRSDPEPGTDPSSGDALGNIFATVLGSCIGNMVGSAIGVSLVDPQDNFRITLGRSLAGSVVGLLGGIGLTAASKGTLWPSLFVGPVAMATAWSERSRKAPESRRVSFSLAPTLNGSLSAVAQLRF